MRLTDNCFFIKPPHTKSLIVASLLMQLIAFQETAYSAVSQILNDNFYQNPAELSLVNKLQITAGNIFIKPSFKFNGTSSGNTGTAVSTVSDALPYLLTAYRFTDKFVSGVNITPSSYGHLEWSTNSIVANDSTTTDLLYYRIGSQSSYQFTKKISFGIGLNIEDNHSFQLNFNVPPNGQKINKISGLNYSGDIGLLYKINSQHALSAVIYSSVNTVGFGFSSLGKSRSNDFAMTISEAPVASISAQHTLSEKWFLEEKIYWSGWSMQKNLVFKNSATGSYSVPTNWYDVLSYQILTRVALIEKIALLGSAIYETNPTPLSTNAIGYPLAASAFFSTGLDIALQKKLSAKIIYGYGTFIHNSKISSPSSKGEISLTNQAIVLQFVYKA